MKLVALNISKLYGCYNYEVHFNPDVTFIYGENGCGKTTILNITEAIITGQLYELFNYAFSEIELVYESNNVHNKPSSIRIENRKRALAVVFQGESYIISQDRIREEMMMEEDGPADVQWRYFESYPFLKQISHTFNYVYLPLNRSAKFNDANINRKSLLMWRRVRSHAYYDSERESVGPREPAMLQIEELIGRKHAEMMSDISEINDGFRNDILKSLLEANKKSSFVDVFDGLADSKNTIDNLSKIKNSYIEILKDLNIVSKQEEDSYIRFFDDFIIDFSEFLQTKQSGVVQGVSIDLLMKYQEVIKMKEIVSIAERIEKKKAKVRKPMDIFIATMNDFIGVTQEEKRIDVDTNGRIYFSTKYSKKPINIQNLSSGEKQLLTFFANLIFNVKEKKAGIFVVDEPELSLHLSWQKMFVERTMSINKNIQLIFATHAPEIIGHRRDKMYKLQKQYMM